MKKFAKSSFLLCLAVSINTYAANNYKEEPSLGTVLLKPGHTAHLHNYLPLKEKLDLNDRLELSLKCQEGQSLPEILAELDTPTHMVPVRFGPECGLERKSKLFNPNYIHLDSDLNAKAKLINLKNVDILIQKKIGVSIEIKPTKK